jgi:Xaa-Pro aminopeptidase
VARDVLRTVQPGPSERELAAVIDYKLKSAGFARPAFDTIVAAGSNAALPHARPGGRRLHTGDLVLLDFGGVYDGYCVDLTRTVCLGRADEEMHRVYDAVAQAQRAALSVVAPGVAAAAVDAAARMVLADRGLSEAFGHGLGHGLGVEVHEAPRVAPRRPGSSASGSDASFETDMELIAEGMVFTIEPGAYLPGWGGVRLEDDVLVTADGCEVLTDVPRELLV